MNTFDIIILAIALSVDASVVSFSQGLFFVQNKRKNSFILALSFGIFQAVMPLLGWFLAKCIYKYVETFSSCIAFLIFLALGIKIIYDAIKEDAKEVQKVRYTLSLDYLFLVSLATSIDALGAGVNLYFLCAPVLFSCILIGIVTFINSLVSFWTGYLFKSFPSKYMEIFAGIILILLAIRVLMLS